MKSLEIKDLILLWHLDYYDGMLSGICLYNNKPYYFYCEETNPKIYETKEGEEFDGWYRKFNLVALTKKEYLKEIASHYFAKKYVSENSEYKDNKQIQGIVREQSLWHLFYENDNLKIDRMPYQQRKTKAVLYN